MNDFNYNPSRYISVSHTTDDLVFTWDPDVPLVVDEAIELPQLDLVLNTTGDCTQVYSTGAWSLENIQSYFKIYNLDK